MRQTRLGQLVLDIGNFVAFAVRRFFAEKMNAAAASLSYSTLLAIVPLLVIAFAILSSFPAFDAVKGRMETLFFSAVVPEAGAAVEGYLASFTSNASNLTTVGIVALAVTALLLLSTIEDTLNRIWHVDRPRPILIRFLIFWAILTLGPLLFGASFTLTSDLMTLVARAELLGIGDTSTEPILQGSAFVSVLLSIAINTIGFTILFVLVPARRVLIRHAVAGACFAAVSFEILSWGFNSYLTSGSSYETIYGAVAAGPIFLIWIYTSWMVIILGAVIAASLPDWLLTKGTISNAELHLSERLAIAVVLLERLHRNAQTGGTMAERDLADAVPLEARDEILDALHSQGYLAQVEGGCVALVRDLHTMTLFDLANDLGLTLGVRADRNDSTWSELVAGVAADLTSTDKLLGRLHEAEVEILSEPLASILLALEETPETADVTKILSRS